MKAIEPSEILTDRSGTVFEGRAAPQPWMRLLARYFDYALFFSLLALLRKTTGIGMGPVRYESLIPIGYALWIPLEALLLSTWGKTPGKWLLKVQLHYGQGKKLDFSGALKRSFLVWLRGLGMAIPIVHVFCLLVAYQKLMALKKTSWDRDLHITALHFPIPPWRWIFAAILTSAGLIATNSIR